MLDNAVGVDDKAMSHLAEALSSHSASERLDVWIETLVMKRKLAPHHWISAWLFATDFKVVDRIRQKMAAVTVASLGTRSTTWTNDTLFGLCVSRDLNSTVRTMKDLTQMSALVHIGMIFESKRCRATLAKDFVSILAIISCNSRLLCYESGDNILTFFLTSCLWHSEIFLIWGTLDYEVQNLLILWGQDIG